MTALLNKNIDEVLAIGRLYEFCSNRRFHLIRNEFISDEIGKIALEINNRIKIVKGIDLFEAKTEKDLIEYEKTLNNFTTEFSNKTFGSVIATDDIELYKNQYSFSRDRMSAFQIETRDNYKPYVKKYPITIPTIISACKQPDYASYVEKAISFFITKKIKIGGRDKILLTHLGFSNPDNIQKFKMQTSTFNRGLQTTYLDNTEIPESLIIEIIFIFDYDKFQHLIDSPVKLFIKGIDLYGATVILNGIRKKLYFNYILPPHITSLPDEYKVQSEKRDSMNVISIVKRSRITQTVLLLYGINMNKILDAFLYGNK